jgi:ribosomal protein L31
MEPGRQFNERGFNEYGFHQDSRCQSSDCGRPVTGHTLRSAIFGGAVEDGRTVKTCSKCHKYYTGEDRPAPERS